MPSQPSAQSLLTLIHDLIDYAGLFPPAGVSMDKAVAEYAKARLGADQKSLARFISPMKRLGEFSASAKPYLPTNAPGDDKAAPESWRLSVLIDGDLEAELEAIEAFNADHEIAGHGSHKHAHSAAIDTIEIKVQTPDIIDTAVEILPEDLFPFFELPPDGDFRGFAAALAGTGFGAKLRTGGIKPEMFPAAETIADFILAMHQSGVPFKATAGLHHPVRSEHPLTYEPNSVRGTMHGFVNVFLSAVLVRHARATREQIVEVLGCADPAAFTFTDAGAKVKSFSVTTEQIRDTRENFAICFGSCSFDEPLADLRKLGWM